MTEPADTTESNDSLDENPSPDDPEQAQPDPEPSPNSEAARYRVQLREAEAARDALAERITGYQRRECETAVADLLDEPGDLWTIGQADMSTFYTDDGELDEAELRAAAGALIEARPKLAKPPGDRHHNFGQYAPPPPAPPVGWGAVIK